MKKLSNLFLIIVVIASIIPVFAQEDTNDGLGPIQIEFTGILTYEDVNGDGIVEILVGGVVISPLTGFDANAYPAGQRFTVRGYLRADDTLEGASFSVAAEATPEATPVSEATPTPINVSTDEPTEDERDQAEDEREREEERREEEQEREEEQREREEERRQEELERDEAQRGDQTITEISGEITAVTQNYIVVDEVEVSSGGIFQPSQFEVGQRVTITGMFENNGMLRALTIEEIADTDAAEDMPEPESTSEATEMPSCISENHPVVTTLANEFEIPTTSIIELHCAGNGFGDITRALLLSAETGTPPAVYLDRLLNGQDWGQIAREAGFEPGELSPGGVIGGRGQGN